jgi:hypothetical protein
MIVGNKMIERFQGVNRTALVDALLRQDFVQNNKAIAEEFITTGELLEFNPGETLIVQDDHTNESTVKNAISCCGGFDRGRRRGAGVERGDESSQNQAQ